MGLVVNPCFILAVFLAIIVHCLDPRYAKNITVYHFHPITHSLVPINQNTADFDGSILFDAYSAYLPYLCKVQYIPNLCENPEIVDPEQKVVLTELILEVDTRYGMYGKCNICYKGQDPFDNTTKCHPGEYVCNCSPFGPVSNDAVAVRTKSPCGAAVGLANASNIPYQKCSGVPHFLCWAFALGKKIGGGWYSTTSKGYCHSGSSSNCTWRFVKAVQQINKTCHEDIFLTAVEQLNKDCFKECSGRDPLSPCWMNCYVSAVIGPDAMVGEPGGLSAQQLREIWGLSLRAPEDGGCPRLPLSQHAALPGSDLADGTAEEQ